MSKGCCCCKKKVAPIPVVVTREEIAPIDIPKEKPNGYARLYAGKIFSLFVYSILSFNQ
jgi:hypothetical protein